MKEMFLKALAASAAVGVFGSGAYVGVSTINSIIDSRISANSTASSGEASDSGQVDAKKLIVNGLSKLLK